MRYDLKTFDSCVEYYRKSLESFKKKNVFVMFKNTDKRAFYSMAPLSRALHELGCEISATGYGKEREGLDALFDVWQSYADLKEGIVNEKTTALKRFIEETKKKIPDFENLF